MTYKFRLVSTLNLVFTIIIPLFLVLMSFFWITSFIAFVIAIILVIITLTVSVFWLPRYTATAQVEITLENEGLSIRWLKQFWLHRKSNVFINWQDLLEYKYKPELQFSFFRIITRKRVKTTLRHDHNYSGKDDYEAFLHDFQNKVADINTTLEYSKKIKKAKSFHETKLGLIVAVVLVLFFIATLFIFILFPRHNSSHNIIKGLALILTGLPTCIFFIKQVYNHRFSKKQNSYS